MSRNDERPDVPQPVDRGSGGTLAGDYDIAEDLVGDARSIGALHGSARGGRNVSRRIAAMDRLGDLSGEHLLDAGCATGEYTVALAARFDRVSAIDIERERLAIFAERAPANVTVSEASITNLDVDDATYDVVTMIEVLEHLDDPPAALREIRRVLTPGGRLFLTTPNRAWPFEQHGVKLGSRRVSGLALPGLVWIKPLHRRLSNSGAFSPKDLRELAAGAGLDLTGVTYMMPPLDSLPEGHRAHRASDAIERTRLLRMAQTIVGCLTKPV